MKGGCGKTTISANLAAGLTIRGKKVLLVDTDIKAEASEYCSLKMLRYNTISYHCTQELH